MQIAVSIHKVSWDTAVPTFAYCPQLSQVVAGARHPELWTVFTEDTCQVPACQPHVRGLAPAVCNLRPALRLMSPYLRKGRSPAAHAPAKSSSFLWRPTAFSSYWAQLRFH